VFSRWQRLADDIRSSRNQGMNEQFIKNMPGKHPLAGYFY
jgi:hypothetical protein